MADLAAAVAPIDLLNPLPGAPAAAATGTEADRRAAIAKTAKEFESSFLNAMLQPMFSGVTVGEPFGGGAGEDAFKSFMTEAFAKQMTAKGGVGVAAAVQREMLKLQGLKEEPANGNTNAATGAYRTGYFADRTPHPNDRGPGQGLRIPAPARRGASTAGNLATGQSLST